VHISAAREGTEYGIWVGKLGTLCGGIWQTLGDDNT